MKHLTPEDLYPLEHYARIRPDFRRQVMAHKQERRLALGSHMTLIFEDRLTVQYQVQEMLRIERIFEPDAIAAELAVYNPLIPDGHNLKATLFLEYESVEERTRELHRLAGIEHQVWLRIGAGAPLWVVADPDLERSAPEKTSAVHFLRFDLPANDAEAICAGALVMIGIEDARYPVRVPLPSPLTQSLCSDLA